VGLPNVPGTDGGAGVTGGGSAGGSEAGSSGGPTGTGEVRGGGEFAVIERIRGQLPGPPAGERWMGDDAAVVVSPGQLLLLTTDLAVAGVHGDLALIGADDFGWRAVAGAVSDVAAMGGRPAHLLVAAAVPAGTDVEALFGGLAAAAAAHGVPIVGGDLSSSSVLVLAVSVTGSIADGPPPVSRSGARPGDALLVTGPLGASAAGLRALRTGRSDRAQRAKRPDRAHKAKGLSVGGRPPEVLDPVEVHCRPWARLDEGEAARRAGASAMIDVSDGLASDLGHLARESGVGVRLDDVPVAPGATGAEALGGGEDYELIVATADPVGLLDAFVEAGLRRPIPIGVCVADPSTRTLRGSDLPEAGWEHDIG
jgi:thiamine-monophosphate kinase